MKIEIDEISAVTILGLALVIMLISFVWFGTKAGIHEREQIVKAKTCEQIAAITGRFTDSGILMCQGK